MPCASISQSRYETTDIYILSGIINGFYQLVAVSTRDLSPLSVMNTSPSTTLQALK